MKRTLLFFFFFVFFIYSCTNESQQDKYKNYSLPKGYQLFDGDVLKNRMMYDCGSISIPGNDYLVFSSDYGNSWDSLEINEGLSVVHLDFEGDKALVELADTKGSKIFKCLDFDLKRIIDYP